KTYYGMPGFANADGKTVVFVQPAAKFGTRYATLGLEQPAHLDDGDMWATAFAITAWTDAVERRVRELVTRAGSCLQRHRERRRPGEGDAAQSSSARAKARATSSRSTAWSTSGRRLT